MQTAKSAIVCGILETTLTPILVLQPVSAATALSSSVSVASAIAATNDGVLAWAPYLCTTLATAFIRDRDDALGLIDDGCAVQSNFCDVGPTAQAWAATSASLAQSASAAASAAASVSHCLSSHNPSQTACEEAFQTGHVVVSNICLWRPPVRSPAMQNQSQANICMVLKAPPALRRLAQFKSLRR